MTLIFPIHLVELAQLGKMSVLALYIFVIKTYATSKEDQKHWYKIEVQQESAYGLAAWESLQYWHVSLQIFLLELMMPEKFAQ